MTFKAREEYVEKPEKTRTVYGDFQYLVWQREGFDSFGDWHWNLKDIIFEKYLGSSPSVIITGEINNIPITKIGENAFKNHDEIKAVSLPDKIKIIGDNAFKGCVNLKKINLPVNIVHIGKSAFEGCEKLSVKCKNAIKRKQNNLFDYMVFFADGINSIINLRYRGNASSIWDCKYKKPDKPAGKNLTLVIPGNIEGLPVITARLNNLPAGFTAVKLPASIKDLTAKYFDKSDHLEKIIIHKNNPVYKSIDGAVYDKAGERLLFCPRGKTGVLKISDSMKEFDNYAFDNNIKLTNFIVSKNNKIYSAKNGALFNKNGDKLVLCLPCIDEQCTIPEGIKTIGLKAFYYCTHITSINFPKSLKIIEDCAFWGCKNIKEIILEEGVTDIGVWSFKSCENLDTFKIPKALVNIGYEAFEGDENLSAVCKKRIKKIISEQIKREGCSAYDYSLYGISGSEWFGPVHINPDVMNISKYRGRDKVVTVPPVICGVKNIIIGSEAFRGCDFIKEIKLPASVIRIESGALAGCVSLEDKNRRSIAKRFGKDVFELFPNEL